MALLSEAEDNYYITAKYSLDIANRAYDLFIRSEVEERRQLIKLTLQNLRVEGKIVRYDGLKPFDTILNFNDNQLWLTKLDDYRRNKWLEEVEFPEFMCQEAQYFLTLPHNTTHYIYT